MLGLWATSGFSCSSNNPRSNLSGLKHSDVKCCLPLCNLPDVFQDGVFGPLHVDRLFVSEQNPTAVVLAQTVREMLGAVSISIRPLKSLGSH
jgi:hypothetical protein